jgi:hypothetical protein
MATDADAPLERAYPYRAGWRVAGCMTLFFALLGVGGTALVPVGCEKVRQGQLPIGVALTIIGLFGMPMLLLAVASIAMGIRDAFRPPLLRVTPTTLVLPEGLRGDPPQDEQGEPKPNAPPPQPSEIPFAAIRWVRREGKPNPGSDRLVIVHDLAPTTLVIEQFMMRTGDFDELETVLRAAVPAAFAAAPPVTPPAPPSPPAA